LERKKNIFTINHVVPWSRFMAFMIFKNFAVKIANDPVQIVLLISLVF